MRPICTAPSGFSRFALARVALVVAEPGLLDAPVHVLIRLPDVLATAAEAEGLEAHRLERDVAGEDHQVGPGDLAAVLLLDRPEQAPRLVEADVVRPAVERREALLAAAAAAAAVADAVGAGAVPRHADERAGRSGRSPPATSPASRSSAPPGPSSAPRSRGSGTPWRSRSPRPSGWTWTECWCSRSSRSWFGHQSRFEVPPPMEWWKGHFASVVMALDSGLGGTSTWRARSIQRTRRALQGPRSSIARELPRPPARTIWMVCFLVRRVSF